MAAAAPPPAGGPNNLHQLAPESLHAMWIEEQRAKSVVRLGIAQTNKRQGSATGFIVVNTAKRLVVMTCGHSFKEWAQGTEISVQFHDKTDGRAEAVWVNTKTEVALLLIGTSSIPDLSEYPAVEQLQPGP
ncbi:hypothetical protein PVAP13_2KG284200 [Panicum virgatum]|uniref:Serine protease n=1 Tax=Panicum virgatum TaxID=38727 RepID=A0A8T0W611_PANVG|nr:hypothetical protein PVAP13_2KG284200 [Panicum virgatum]